MENRDFKQRVLEEQIFDELKDTSIKSSVYFRRKYEGADINYSRIYRRIVNYQVKEYGASLNNYVPKKTRLQLLIDNQKARARRYQRRNRRYENNRFIK